ncbi:MAG: bifunctional precorrin-2 dehydrogenase/sirohydrochlorin ferrochelatase [Methanobacteriaceae archaeon]|nr:bifunctional precorrin-2 dehydrogenase/sirohydrochlorin ferrochelatase [Methanobacteriaceae archaeon]
MGLTSLFVNAKNENILIIGTGEVGLRRAYRFLEAESNVNIITKDIDPDIKQDLINKGAIFHNQTQLYPLIKTSHIIIAATNDHQLNQEIAKKTNKHQQLLNLPDNPSQGNIIIPSTFKIEDIIISIYTNSKSPLMAKTLRKKIQKTITKQDIQNIKLQEHIRKKLKKEIPTQKERKKLMEIIQQDNNIQRLLKEDKTIEAQKQAELMINNKIRGI